MKSKFLICNIEPVLQLAEDDDGFASCGEDDDETVKKTNEDFKEDRTGDPIHDQYLFMKAITNKEERSKSITQILY